MIRFDIAYEVIDQRARDVKHRLGVVGMCSPCPGGIIVRTLGLREQQLAVDDDNFDESGGVDSVITGEGLVSFRPLGLANLAEIYPMIPNGETLRFQSDDEANRYFVARFEQP